MRTKKRLVLTLTGYLALLSLFTNLPYNEYKQSFNAKQQSTPIEVSEDNNAMNEKESIFSDIILPNDLSFIFINPIKDNSKSSNLSINNTNSYLTEHMTVTNTNLVTDKVQLNKDKVIVPLSVKIVKEEKLPLIYDSKSVDYMSYIPKLVASSKIEDSLDIKNPDITIAASSAILFNATTGEVLYYKDPVIPVFPSSTTKLLSSLVALDWCSKDEEVTVGNEIKMIASDSSKANLKQGQVLTVSSLLNGMLLPSGNDAAYVMAVYVGRKSLQMPKAKNWEALLEFTRLMNLKAKDLGAENSNFITPDGYDALGQYTTAHDMGRIGIAAAKNKTILSISKKSSAKNTFISGEKVTWNNTNALIKKGSPWYYSNAIGLKTGTTTMAGRCLISAAREGDNIVICVIMHSSSEGRWKDSTKLIKYGLKKLQ